MATGEIFQLQAKDAVLKLNHYAAINAVQSFDWEPSFNEEYYDELGNANHASQSITPEVSGSFEMTATGATVAFLKRMITKFNASTKEFEGYMAGSTPDNAGTITGLDLERAVFDIVEAKKANEQFTRSLLLPRMHLSSLSMRADANGAATESYSFEGELAEVYREPNHDLTPLPVTRVDADTVRVADTATYKVEVSGGAAATFATHYALYLMVDDNVIAAANLDPVWTNADASADGSTEAFSGDINLTGGHTVPVGARLSLVVAKKTAGSFPAISYPTTARFVRADQIDIFLVAKGTVDIAGLAAGSLNTYNFANADRLLRVQSADISVDLRREALRQLAKNDRKSAVFYRAATYPLQVTASATAFETDLADWAKMQGKSATDVLNLEDFEGQEWQIVMRYYKAGTVMQTVALCDARVSGRGARVAVGGRSEVTWNFTGSNVKIEGSNV